MSLLTETVRALGFGNEYYNIKEKHNEYLHAQTNALRKWVYRTQCRYHKYLQDEHFSTDIGTDLFRYIISFYLYNRDTDSFPFNFTLFISHCLPKEKSKADIRGNYKKTIKRKDMVFFLCLFLEDNLVTNTFPLSTSRKKAIKELSQNTLYSSKELFRELVSIFIKKD